MVQILTRTRARMVGALIAIALAALGVVVVAVFPAAAASTTYQAESAGLTGGAVTATDHAGYTGTGFVGGYTDTNKGNTKTTFSVTPAAAGNDTVTVRYANGTTATKTVSLYVNGTRIRQISLGATANWDSWGTETETITLHSGANTVAYKFDTTDSGNVNLDNIVVSTIAAPPAGTYEAETAALAGGAAVQGDHAGYTGTGFVGGYTDGNKGNANTTFTVSASAGSATVALRYANGNGVSMTLSLYVNGSKLKQITLAATANWDTWATETETVSLGAGDNAVSYKFDTTDSGNVNLDNIVVTAVSTPPTTTPPTSPTTPPPPTGGYEAETAFMSGGPGVASSTSGYSGTGYVTGFAATGARVIIAVNVATAGTHPTILRYANGSGSTKTISLYANGLKVAQISAPAGSGWLAVTTAVGLRSGLNLIGYQQDSGDSGGISVDSVAVTGGTALATRGATVPYTEFPASSATTNGTVLAANRTFLTLASEATGRRAVQLTATGQFVQVTLTQPANSMVIRYSIPDNAAGTGVSAPISLYANGTKVQDITLTSKYSWTYGVYPYDNNPGEGSAHHFFDETRTLIGNWPAGTVLKLQKDANDTAASYTIDVIDTEQVDAAFTMPANFVSITSSGATAGDGTDDTFAINSAIASAKSAGKGVWIPAGTFNINARVNVAGVSVRGAGEWYSTLQGLNGKGGFFATGANVQLADLTFAGDVTYRNDSGFDTGIEGNFGTGSLVFDVWVEHAKVGMWIDSGTNGLYTAGVRLRDVWADGVNIHANVTNARIDQSHIRNSGDDALAMFSDGTPVTNSAFTFDTVQTPLLANGIGIYGGANNVASDNLISDTVTGSAGIAVSTRFGVPFSGPTTVTRNTLSRTSGFEPNWQSSIGAIWIYANQSNITTPVTVSYNTINDSTYQAILLSDAHQISNLLLDHDTIAGAGTYGIDIFPNMTGSLTANFVTVTGAAAGGLHNPGSYTINRGAGDTGW